MFLGSSLQHTHEGRTKSEQVPHHPCCCLTVFATNDGATRGSLGSVGRSGPISSPIISHAEE